VTSGDVDLPTALKTAAKMLGDVDLPFGGADVRDDVLAREDIDQEERDLIEFLADESPGAAKRHDLYEHLRGLKEEDVDALRERLGLTPPFWRGQLTSSPLVTSPAARRSQRRQAEARRAQALSTGTKALVRREGPGPRQPDDPAIATLALEGIDDLTLSALLEKGMDKGAKIHTKMIADFPELAADGKFGGKHWELMYDLRDNGGPLSAKDITKKETLQFLKDNPKITKAYNAAGLFKDTSKKRERSPFEGVTRPLPSESDDFDFDTELMLAQ
jgi:hypothetical protein